MNKKNESGKSRLIKGALFYLWEEMKTLNRAKFKAMSRMLSGYLKMKFSHPKKISTQRKIVHQNNLSPQ